MKISFVDLTVPTERIRQDYLKEVDAFLQRGNFILTKEVEDFEKAWAEYVGVPYCVGVSNGSDALFLALRAMDIGPGDEVITQGTAYNACVVAMLRVGATPRFVDVDPVTLKLDVAKLEALITSKTKAIMPVHLYGTPQDMDVILKIAKQKKLSVLEDCAQAHGIPVRGDIATFSFYPTKNLGAFGDAGAVVTKNRQLYEKLCMLRNMGQKQKNDHQIMGYNMRLDPLQAIALRLKLRSLDASIAFRRKAAKIYDDLLGRNHNPDSVYHLYVIEVSNREEVMKKLSEQGIQTAIHYPVLVYNQPFYEGPRDACPVSDKVCSRILSLPFYEGITEEQQNYVVTMLKKILA